MKFRKAGVPDGLPSLDAGSHSAGEGKACVMELVSVIAGETWSDQPVTVHPCLAAAAIYINDRLPNEDRHLLLPLVGRFFGTRFREATEPLRAYFSEQHALVPELLAPHSVMITFPNNPAESTWVALPFGFRAPCPCPDCNGGRGPQEALAWLTGALDVVDRVRPDDPREVTQEEVLDAFRVVARH